MYPVLFRIGQIEVTSFGVMTALGALAGVWLLRRELAARGLPVEAAEAGVMAVLGGLLGAKLLWTGEHLGEDSLVRLLTDRGGLSWYGGLAGGLAAGVLTIWHRRWPMVPLLASASPALALGQALGRVGCFLVGDDYGRPTQLPWGVAFPRGLPPTTVPVHPTQLYEAGFLAVLTIVLVRWRRRGLTDRALFGRYLLLAGMARFLIEFVRVNARVALGLTVAHWASLGMVVGGVAFIVLASRRAHEPFAHSPEPTSPERR